MRTDDSVTVFDGEKRYIMKYAEFLRSTRSSVDFGSMVTFAVYKSEADAEKTSDMPAKAVWQGLLDLQAGASNGDMSIDLEHGDAFAGAD